MYEKVLVAIDRSENSNRALTAARELASLSDGEVRVLHLREQEIIGRMGLVADESPEEVSIQTLLLLRDRPAVIRGR
jgi:nucleotide-binding universal stress UspA family protein